MKSLGFAVLFLMSSLHTMEGGRSVRWHVGLESTPLFKYLKDRSEVNPLPVGPAVSFDELVARFNQFGYEHGLRAESCSPTGISDVVIIVAHLLRLK